MKVFIGKYKCYLRYLDEHELTKKDIHFILERQDLFGIELKSDSDIITDDCKWDSELYHTALMRVRG